MLRVGICDDDAKVRDGLRWALEKLPAFDGGQAEVIYEFQSGEGAVRWLKQHKNELDLLFLDVELDGISGVEAAKRIRTFDRHILLVFLTGYSDFVFQGYQVEALDYLVKPASAEKLAQVIRRAMVRLEEGEGNDSRFIVMKNSEGTFRIYKDEVICCGSQGRLVHMVLEDGRVLDFYRKLNDMERLLGSRFVRIHQRYLVNSDFVDFVGREQVQLRNGVSLPMSRALRETATTQLARLMIGKC